MDDVYYWLKTVYQLAISVSIVFEFVRFDFEQLEDIIGRITGLKLVCEGVFCWVYPEVFRVFCEGCI